MEKFYDLRSNSILRPVKSVPFESRDFGWLAKAQEDLEEGVSEGEAVEAEFSVDGLSCVGCVWLVENMFQRQEGTLEASAHPTTGLLRLRWMAGRVDLCAFADEMGAFGYSVIPRKSGVVHSEARQLVGKLGLCAAFAMNGMVFTLPRYLGMPEDFAFAGIFQLVGCLSATLAMLVGGTYFISRAWKAARAGMVHIDMPIALGIVFAFAGSLVGWFFKVEGLIYFDFVAVFICLMLAGRYVQLAAVEKNRERLRKHKAVPDTVVSPDSDEVLGLEEIEVGTRLEIGAGQCVPVASTLASGAGEFSLEWINGEAEARLFQPGRALPAGAIFLGSEPVVVSASEKWEDSLLAKLTKGERVVARLPGLERVLRLYLIAIVLVGVVGFAVWIPVAGVAAALQVMISVFVVSCPCALGLALPLADELAGSRMERAGVFIRESLLWSRLCEIRTVIFDKTGTLTLERPVLMNAEAVSGLDEGARLALARLTKGALHPVSRSLLEALGHGGQRMLREVDTVEVRDVPGMGRFYESGGVKWSLGRPGWMKGEASAGFSHDAELCEGSRVVARFRFEESLRADAVAVVGALRERGYRMVVLSGDRREKVAAAAGLLEISEEDAHAGLQPEEKERLVREMDRKDTLYLGDGANDSLAFNAAYVTGTPVVDRSVLESRSDFYFLGQGLRFLPMMLGLAKRRRATVRAAFGFALVYNVAAVGVALAGHMNPLIAAVIMPLSSAVSLGIIGCGLREAKIPVRKSSGASPRGWGEIRPKTSPFSAPV